MNLLELPTQLSIIHQLINYYSRITLRFIILTVIIDLISSNKISNFFTGKKTKDYKLFSHKILTVISRRKKI